MFKYVETTTLILLWCLILSLLLAKVIFFLLTKNLIKIRQKDRSSSLAVFPGLVLGPLVLVLGFQVVGVNLLFPLHFFANLRTIILSALVPGLVLMVASGLWGSVKEMVTGEYGYWQSKPCYLAAKAFGKNADQEIKRIVIIRSLVSSWGRTLPWIFGELIIVEAVFNAPGLGLDAWHLAQVRDFAGLASAILWLAALYGISAFLTAVINYWLGKKLETYI